MGIASDWLYGLVMLGFLMLLIRNAGALDRLTSALVAAMRDVWNLGAG